MSDNGNQEQLRWIVAEAVQQANTLARAEAEDIQERGLRAQLTLTEKVVGACLIALLGWVGFTVQSTDKRVAVIEAKLSTVAEGRYTSDDASRDQRFIAEQIKAHDRRLERLEAYHD